MEGTTQWWSSLTDECPITLEALSSLPYPPFALIDGRSCNKYHFDGLALATYIVSQGNFANPLTRETLTYDDCSRLDEYLNEHVYRERSDHLAQHLAVLGRRERKICVKEAWLLRDSIKVKVGGGSGGSGGGQDESRRRRAEALRNEAAAALRGLFVFGHRSRNDRGGHGDESADDGTSLGRHASNDSWSLAHAPGGFNLHHNPDSNSSNQQDGLRIIDDDEAAFEAADVAAWRGVQEAFPTLPHPDGDRVPQHIHNLNDDKGDSQMLETVRRMAKLTIEEERREAEMLERTRQRCFLQALQRKKDRIDARRRAKEEAASALSREKEAEDVLRSARKEIDQWRALQWEKWERTAHIRSANAKAEDTSSLNEALPEIINQPANGKQQCTSQNQELLAKERAAKAAAKKKAKRQKAKERAKEKKRLEKLEVEKKERALALEREKESSTVKCGACREGILGYGFEKYGGIFCSPKCARNGASAIRN